LPEVLFVTWKVLSFLLKCCVMSKDNFKLTEN
jgi:hypothetical protein